MADENDGYQLMMNWLVGCDLSFVRDDNYECHFLGPTGCTLLFKPFFCLNYNCKALIDSLADVEAAELAKTTGALLRQQYEVEKLLHQICAQFCFLT